MWKAALCVMLAGWVFASAVGCFNKHSQEAGSGLPVNYVGGWSLAEYETGVNRVYKAVMAACRTEGLEVRTKSLEAGIGRIRALDGDVPVRMDIRRKPSIGLTEVSIRWGRDGDKDASMRLQDRIAGIIGKNNW